MADTADFGGPGGRSAILVLAFNRPGHLRSVLDSIQLQGRIGDVHVWIDGTQSRADFGTANVACAEVAQGYPVAEVRAHLGHRGMARQMLNALEHLSARHDRLIILEDDCFPLAGGLAAMEGELAATKDRPEVFSVYGCHFGLEPADDLDFTRFQGWAWAAHSDRIHDILPELRRLFLLSEADYVAEVATRLTPAVRDRLDRTPKRDVLKVLGKFFSWDATIALITAERRMLHRRTPRPAAVNTGIVEGSGHFHSNEPFLRKPPMNMIRLEEAWDRYRLSEEAVERAMGIEPTTFSLGS